MRTFLHRNAATVAVTLVVVVLAYLWYAVQPATSTSVFRFAWSYAVPLVLAALVGVVCERSGVVNIGIEGQMAAAAFGGFFGAAATGSLIAGVAIGMLTGLVAGAFLAWMAVTLRLDQIIAGVVLNIVAAGITSFYYAQGNTLPAVMPRFEVPVLSKIPLIGPVFFTGGPIALLTILVVVFLHVMLFHTRWGLRTRAVGEYPSAADTAGIKVNALRFANTTLAGLLAGAAGAYISMEATSTFEIGMTSGRGFLALAIMIFGIWRPARAFAAALFFGFATGLASQLQSDQVINIPYQFTGLLPYVLTLVVLAIAAGRVRPPAAEGTPFVKGEGS